MQTKQRNVLIISLASLVVSLAILSTASADTVVIVDSGSCPTDEGWIFRSTDVALPTTGQVVVLDLYDRGPPFPRCSVTKGYDIFNSPGGPERGTTRDIPPGDDIRDLLSPSQLCTNLGGITPCDGGVVFDNDFDLRPTIGQCPEPASFLRPCIRWSEASPNEFSWLVVGFDTTGLSSLSIPFAVVNAGDGDWLAIYNREVMFWKQPLSNFEEGKAYWATIPQTELAKAADIYLTFLIHSTGDSNAAIAVPVAVPILPALWLFGSALGLLGWLKRRAI